MEAILLITTFFALYGAYLNSEGKWEGFAIWMITNFLFMLNNWVIGQWQQSFLFFCYFILSLRGLYNLKLKEFN